MTALPGQRAAQRPMRAAVSVQRTLGRALHDSSASSSVLILNVAGRWMRQVVDEEGQERLVPYELGGGEEPSGGR
ncbi:hypothetical protein [Streptomyces boncukensis]|uniref:Uncharacterized protein n=1 Tax=Streptomyces boncukensis TaxID=2711219 RepID=A0A6G4X3V6_9ACTN|nr:hypothetical protein [Streptomyces boncukensis]NGO71351.1 hypothetical protein [Streptomyces boncukensis]